MCPLKQRIEPLFLEVFEHLQYRLLSGDHPKPQLTSDVVNLFSTGTSMAALKSDGSVVTWGLSTEDPRSESLGGDIDTGSPRGGDSSEVPTNSRCRRVKI